MQRSASLKPVVLAVLITLLVSCGGGGVSVFDKAYKDAPTQGSGGQINDGSPNSPPDAEWTNPSGPSDSGMDTQINVTDSTFINTQAITLLNANNDNESSSLTGTIQIEGLTPVTNVVVPMQVEPADNNLRQIVTRIIDDEDNIGSIEYPGVSGDFLFDTVQPGVGYKLNVETIVQEDITGDGIGNDTISLMIPVNFVAGRITNIDVKIGKVAKGKYLVLSSSGDVKNNVVALEYDYTGPEGLRTNEIAVNYSTGTSAFDVNNDGVYDNGDLIGIDRNSDGLFDDIPEGPTQAGAIVIDDRIELSVISGRVTNRWPGRILLQQDGISTKSFEIIVDSRTALADLFGTELNLYDFSSGDIVFVQGFSGQGDTFVGISVIRMISSGNPQSVAR